MTTAVFVAFIRVCGRKFHIH